MDDRLSPSERPPVAGFPDPSEWVVAHSLAWLTIANLVGLLMATLLLFPRLGEMLAPLTYGRWAPLHLNLQLYGWCSLPAIGLLLKLYLPWSSSDTVGRASGSQTLIRLAWLVRLAITVWSASLVFAALWWLDGGSSGKLFLEWSGPARVFMAASLAFLAVVLLISFSRQMGLGRSGPRSAVIGKTILLGSLFAVPGVLYWAAGARIYPSFNPDSGGATGGSLLGSTLGLIAIFCLTPLLLGLQRVGNSHEPGILGTGRSVIVQTFALLGLHFGWFLLLDHGNRSHHELTEIVSLASLVVWIPLLVRYLGIFSWPSNSRQWLKALAFWGVLLVATGVGGFLPGVLERWKFTNALVGHAHIAMAGLVTSFNMLVLLSLGTRSVRWRSASGWAESLAARDAFWLWNIGLGVQVIALMALGTLEGFDPGLVVRWHPLAALAYSVRWIGGAAMVVASVRWLAGSLRVRTAISPEGQPVESAPGGVLV